MKNFLFLIFLVVATTLSAEKQTYISSSAFGSSDLNNSASQWCNARSKTSANFILFWESGYGSNPATAASPYTVNVDNVLAVAESAFAMYADSLKFIVRGSSRTDTYRMIIRLKYSTTWEANGSGIDNTIGMLTLSANAAQAAGVTVAHEVGHCFQYQVHCDGFPGGWMYGLGDNGAGGNCWWEQCAQWQAFKVFPDQQFTDYNYSNYLKWCHKHILHEEPRYANFFIQDYWTYLHGWNFIGRLWQESQSPEDPVDTYKRLNGNMSQAAFNLELFDFAQRAASWDIPHLRSRGEAAMDTRIQCAMHQVDDNYWAVDSARCIENYGYNVIKLNVPDNETTVKAYFEGMVGAAGYRTYNKNQGGWHYGFVALLNDGTRVYGQPQGVQVSLGRYSPQDTVAFVCPDNCQKLWFVVMGAPKSHWHHLWDDDAVNDEQWPYKVKFESTNRLGEKTYTEAVREIKIAPIATESEPYSSVSISLAQLLTETFGTSAETLTEAMGSSLIFYNVKPNGTYTRLPNYGTYGHWFDVDGNLVSESSGVVFSDFNISDFSLSVGQYPGRCAMGDTVTIRHALEYKRSDYSFWLDIVVKVIFAENTALVELTTPTACPVLNTMVSATIKFKTEYQKVTLWNMQGKTVAVASNVCEMDASHLPAGIYLLQADGIMAQIIKQ